MELRGSAGRSTAWRYALAVDDCQNSPVIPRRVGHSRQRSLSREKKDSGEVFKRVASGWRVTVVAAIAVIAIGFVAVRAASAHCDGFDGPVVKAAQKALQTADVNQVLIWVQPQDEDEIKTAFEETLAVRQLNPQAQAFADRYFFETLVRIHRAGENAPYTGLKPAGRDLGPAIPGSRQGP